MPSGPRPQFPVGLARVAISGLNLSSHWVNVFYLRLTHTAALTVNDLETIFNGIADNWGTDVATNMGAGVSLTTVGGTFRQSDGSALEYTHTETKTAAGANQIYDVSACFVVDWSISSYYRGGHPRSYWPGVTGAQTTDGAKLTSATQTNIATAANAWRNHINALTSTNVTQVEMGTVRYQANKLWLDPPVFYPFTSAKCSPYMGTQRRRIRS